MVAPCSYFLCRVKALGLEPYGNKGPQGTSKEVFQISIKAPSPRVLHGKECNEKRENPIGEGMQKRRG
jgi:hypothetical protein